VAGVLLSDRFAKRLGQSVKKTEAGSISYDPTSRVPYTVFPTYVVKVLDGPDGDGVYEVVILHINPLTLERTELGEAYAIELDG
jgi:hypothetical protein